jgi:hypothetical protein
MTTRQTLKDFLRNYMGTQQDSISYKVASEDGLIQRGDDLGKEPQLDKPLLDLTAESAGILGDYLSYIVDLSSNEYKINPGNEKAAPSNRGDSLVIAEEQGAKNVFVPQGTKDYASLSEYSDSKYHYSENQTLQDIIDKTGAEGTPRLHLNKVKGRPNDVSGQTIVDATGEDNIIVKSTQDMLKNNNRFSNTIGGSAFAPQGKNIEDFNNPQGDSKTGTTTSQVEFGDYQKNIEKVTFKSLKEIGSSLLLKSTGFDNGWTPGSSDDPSVRLAQIENMSNNPQADTYTELGYVRRNIGTLRAMNAKGFPSKMKSGISTRAGKGTILPNDPDANNNKSFGATYNSAMPFTSPNTVSAKIQTAATIVALIKATNDFFDLIESLSALSFHAQESGNDSSVEEKKYRGPGPHKYGMHRPSTSAKVDFLKKILLTETTYPYSDCVEMGIKVFFGKENQNILKVSQTDTISQSDGYWQAVAASVLKSMTALDGKVFGMISTNNVDFSPDNIAASLKAFSSNKVLGFMNTCAVIGDMYLRRSGGNKDLDSFTRSVSRFDVDSLPDGPGTRISKSRAANGRSPLTLAWNSNAIPSMYLLPKNVVRAVTDMNSLTVGTNPMKGMLGTDLINNTYLDHNHDGSYNRIPQDVVKRLEDRLDAEYVPFYIQDLRTNEVIAFHAFLTKLTDTIKADYDSVSGYGRMDPVQIYKGTTRNVQVGFTLMATSREDFDMMWYKINKLTTLLYPQWTKGTTVQAGGNIFTQPFSQVLGASPLIRVRVGDVIKSNYSKFNLSRIFGIGDKDTVIGDPTGEITPGTTIMSEGIFVKQSQIAIDWQKAKNASQELGMKLFYIAYGTPFALTAALKDNPLLMKTTENLMSNFLTNGFVNPLGASFITKMLTSPDQSPIRPPPGINTAALGERFLSKIQDPWGFMKMSFHYLKPTSKGYKCIDDGKIYNLTRSLRIMISGRIDSNTLPVGNPYVKDPAYKEAERSDFNYDRRAYEIVILDFAAPANLFNKKFEVYHDDILANPSFMFNLYMMPLFADIAGAAGLIQNVAREAAIAAGIGTDAVDSLATQLLSSNEKKFMLSENNPIVRAYDTTKGRGLAGVIDGFTFNWLDDDFAWETDWNARAPMGVNIDFNLSVIHDIPPGLDHSGYNRAPLYNVGEVMRHVAGDPHDDDGTGSEFAYKNSARSAFRRTKTKGE